MAKSRFAEKFNHDTQAHDYDCNVLDETNPIRAGYSACLDWVVQQAGLSADCSVLELGAGSGNLTMRLSPYRKLVCVDVSEQMLHRAQAKLPAASHVAWEVSDLLEFMDRSTETFDRIVSTYAIHHLTDEEKWEFFANLGRALTPTGLAVFGDLMFENDNAKKLFFDECRRSVRNDLIDNIAGEFFWNVESATKALEKQGFQTAVERFSELSWGIAAWKERPSRYLGCS